MRQFTAEEVLSREELIMDRSVEDKYLVYLGEWPNNSATDEAGNRFVPVLYKSQPRKVLV